jgi:hypothetical protein
MTATRVRALGIVLLGVASAGLRANTPNFPVVDPVVRLQGSDPSKGATGTLIGARQIGSEYRMVFIGADHTYQRVGPITSIGFGNLGAPILNLSNFMNLTTLLAPTIVGLGPIDLGVYEVSIDLNTLNVNDRSYLTGITPVNVAAAPLLAGYAITGVGFGLDGFVSNAYGTQLSFSNTINSYFAFNSSYTTDKNNNPLNYSEMLSTWTTQPAPGLGACVTGCSGSTLFLAGAPNTMVGFQVNGSLAPGGTNLGLEFTPDYVSFINSTSALYLAPVPIPAAAWLLGSALTWLGGLGFTDRRRRTASADHD